MRPAEDTLEPLSQEVNLTPFPRLLAAAAVALIHDSNARAPELGVAPTLGLGRLPVPS